MKKWHFSVLLCCFVMQHGLAQLPNNFTYLHDIDPSILQEIRYAGNHNFIGRPIPGYEKGICILSEPAANALKQVQMELRHRGLTLKVYDCYRPVLAVREFVQWSKRSHDDSMKNEFYPRVAKDQLFTEGYLAQYSGHSRGSTVDLTIVDCTHMDSETYHTGQLLINCYAPWTQRFRDNSIDMGTGYDCLDKTASPNNKTISKKGQANRLLLRQIMMKYGFIPNEKEWWHFSLKKEPFPKTYFNFPVS
jgi:zinc D-Ala-D-Ala dipeptidase